MRLRLFGGWLFFRAYRCRGIFHVQLRIGRLNEPTREERYARALARSNASRAAHGLRPLPGRGVP